MIPMRTDPGDHPSQRWSDQPLEIGAFVRHYAVFLAYIAIMVTLNVILTLWLR
jgi:hypothetical protein